MILAKTVDENDPHRKVFTVGDLVTHFIYKDQLFIVTSVEENGNVRLYSVKQRTLNDCSTDARVLDFVE